MATQSKSESSEAEQEEDSSVPKRLASAAILMKWTVDLWNSLTSFLGYEDGIELIQEVLRFLLEVFS